MCTKFNRQWGGIKLLSKINMNGAGHQTKMYSIFKRQNGKRLN